MSANKFFTADTHFSHAAIIKYCKRPFKTVEEMNKLMIEKWNKKVPKDGVVYHIGDFCYGRAAPILERLNGTIILIKGSHDWLNKADRAKFARVELLANIKIEEQPITLCHYCMRTWHKSHYDAWHLHGHSHGRLDPIGKMWDVGVDCNGFEPLSWEDIKAIMAKRPHNFNFIKGKDNEQHSSTGKKHSNASTPRSEEGNG